MDGLFLVSYLALLLVTYLRSRSVAWTVIMLVASVSVFGVFVNLLLDLGHLWTRLELQWLLTAAFGVVAGISFLAPALRGAPRRRQLVAVGVPFLVLVAFFTVMTVLWTDEPAFLNPVGFLMGHAVAEDNAKWLDFAAQYASGLPIDQGVAMGGPLQLVLVFVGTIAGTISQLALGGYNQVAVAANTVIMGQYFLVALAPLALAPFAEAWLRKPTGGSATGRTRIPWPLIWTGALVLTAANLMLTAYGHLTLQYTILVAALWSATFLAAPRIPRARLLTSLSVAAGMTVWLPMNVLAAGIIAVSLVVLVGRAIRHGRSGFDPIGLALVAFVGICLWEPLRSSLAYLVDSAPAAAGAVGAGLGGGLRTAAAVVHGVPGLGWIPAGLDDSTLFAAGGGTEEAGPILLVLAAAAVLAASVVASRQELTRAAFLRLLPVGALALTALAIAFADQWATGSAPHYGSLKFTFMTTVVVLGACLPVALVLVDPASTAMTLARWAGVGAVVFLLVGDSLLIRSIAAARPEQWSPPIPFNNPRSYWWPAEVNGTADQAIESNPIACVYLPQGAKVPSAILDSQLSGPQQVYACTRQLAGLAGADATAQPIVDWLRREWLTNTRAWAESYPSLEAMPDSVLDRRVILLDDGSNVIGLETMRSLLERYPKFAGKTAEELAALGVTP